MARMFRPLGRLSRRLLAHLRPAVVRLAGWGRTLVAHLEPALRLVAGAADQVERAAARLGVGLGRALGPVRRAVAQVRASWSSSRA
jgi:hypothetical protein